MAINLYFVEEKKAKEITQKLEQFVSLERKGKRYYLLECDFSNGFRGLCDEKRVNEIIDEIEKKINL